MRSVFLATALIGSLSPQLTRAEDLTRLALTLGEMFGAEKTCNIEFDTEAIEKFIQTKVPADDIEFMSTVSTAASVAPGDFEEMTVAVRAAHCTQMRRLAAKFKLTKS